LELHAVSSIRALVGAIRGLEPRCWGLCVKLRLRVDGGRTAFRPVLAFGIPGSGPSSAMPIGVSRGTYILDLHAVFCIPTLEGTLKVPEPACFGICDKLRARQGGLKTASRSAFRFCHFLSFDRSQWWPRAGGECQKRRNNDWGSERDPTARIWPPYIGYMWIKKHP